MSDKGKNSKIDNEINNENEIEIIPSAVEIGYLTTAILDYYESTGSQQLEEGEEWKKLDPNKYMLKGVEIPDDLDKEIKKAFIAQIKKFQK